MRARERTRLFRYHKPRGLVTTHSDPQGRPTIFAALPKDLPRLISIGRLDINTEGLLLLTNDGGLARVLELPATGWLRRYRVRAFGRVHAGRRSTACATASRSTGVHYGPIEATLDREQGANVWLTVGIREGKNREVRKVLETLDLQVNRLIRVAFGPFELGELEDGAVEEVETEEVTRATRRELSPRRPDADFDAPLIDPRLPRVSAELARSAPRSDGTHICKPHAAQDGIGESADKKKAAPPRPYRRAAAEISEAKIMRVVGGRFRSRPLAGPKSDAVRPTADRLREALFNILAHAYGDPVTGARVLDLFAGTGALGIEAISRGAAYALFVDDGVEARALLRDNVEALGLGGVTRIFRRDATKLGPAHPLEPFTLVFLDPPYGKGLAEKALMSAREGGWLNRGA